MGRENGLPGDFVIRIPILPVCLTESYLPTPPVLSPNTIPLEVRIEHTRIGEVATLFGLEQEGTYLQRCQQQAQELRSQGSARELARRGDKIG